VDFNYAFTVSNSKDFVKQQKTYDAQRTVERVNLSIQTAQKAAFIFYKQLTFRFFSSVEGMISEWYNAKQDEITLLSRKVNEL
jgi:hypothetical protein